MSFNVRLFLIAAFTLFSSLAVQASTITTVEFSGTALNPTITVFGSGFGDAPAPTAIALYGYTGLDYGTSLHITDTTTDPLFDAGYDQPALGYHDTIGLVNLIYTDTLISFNLGSVYEDYPVHFNEGDSYTFHLGADSFTGSVEYAPEPSSVAFLGTGILAAFSVVRRRTV